MAEFVEKRCEDMIPELEQMERIKLFDKNEIRGIAKKRKEYEYKIQRHTKCKEDYLRYIQYEMDLLKLVKQRREKLSIMQKKSDIDYTIANKVNKLYKLAISKFQDDIRFWMSYMKFCKHVKFHNCVGRMIGKMLQIHQDKPKCWHITARWEIEESKNIQNARQFLLRGLHHHPDSQLLLTDAFRLELDEAATSKKPNDADENGKDEKSLDTAGDGEMSIGHKRACVIYKQALKRVKDIKFIVELLNIAREYEETEKLQNIIVSDMIEEYSNKPLMWDTMARRELMGLPQPMDTETPMEIENESSSLRDRISACNEVYLAAVKRIKTDEMWSFYIDCMMEINHDSSSLPNYKKKLLKNALIRAHQARKLREKYYVLWIEMLNKEKKDENSQKRLYEVLNWATEASPSSVNLWHAKLRYLLTSGRDTEAITEFTKASEILGDKSLPLWRMRLMDAQVKSPEKVEGIFIASLKAHPSIVKEMRPSYIEWLVLVKDIEAARQVYNDLCLQPPICLELHKKMAALELMQPEISLRHVRRAHEISALQFGTSYTDVWIDYITFEMRHGDSQRATDIHRRAIKTLEPALSDIFISEYSLLKANPESIDGNLKN